MSDLLTREQIEQTIEDIRTGSPIGITRAIALCHQSLLALKDEPEGWVSVKERLPKEGETVLAFWKPMVELNPSCWCVATHWPGRWHNPDDDEDDYAEPSHWMPLPAPPKPSRG